MKKICIFFCAALFSACSSTQISQTIGEVNKAIELEQPLTTGEVSVLFAMPAVPCIGPVVILKSFTLQQPFTQVAYFTVACFRSERYSHGGVGFKLGI